MQRSSPAIPSPEPLRGVGSQASLSQLTRAVTGWLQSLGPVFVMTR